MDTAGLNTLGCLGSGCRLSYGCLLGQLQSCSVQGSPRIPRILKIRVDSVTKPYPSVGFLIRKQQSFDTAHLRVNLVQDLGFRTARIFQAEMMTQQNFLEWLEGDANTQEDPGRWSSGDCSLGLRVHE